MFWKTPTTVILATLLAAEASADTGVVVLPYQSTDHYRIKVSHRDISSRFNYRVAIGRTPNPKVSIEKLQAGSLTISIPSRELNRGKNSAKSFSLRLIAAGTADIQVVVVRLALDTSADQLAALRAENRRLRSTNTTLQSKLNKCRTPSTSTTGLIRREFKAGKLGELLDCWPLKPGKGKMDMEMGTHKNDAKVRCTSRFRIVRTGVVERLFLLVSFFCQEQGSDRTRFNGTTWREVYVAPKGKRIIGVQRRGLPAVFDTRTQLLKRSKQVAGFPPRDVGNLWGWRTLPEGFPAWHWRDLEIHVDNRWKSRSPVGVRGTIEFRVELQDK